MRIFNSEGEVMKRLKEPSTWAGLGVLVVGVLSGVGPLLGLSVEAVQALAAAVSAVTGAAAVVIREKTAQ